MKANEIRKAFLDFFAQKQHLVVSSAPIVVKNDPTLMFNNAGMNQFKDFFLGNTPPTAPRIANSQKCMRVSGKHNDLEEVGVDTYHHTMFEMLGNWSFGDYFKKEAIQWSWEFLTEVAKLPKDRLYVTVFEGSEAENVPRDSESIDIWRQLVHEDHILLGNKKDNFWEMGDTGPCGPCTEIHVDMRPDNEVALVAGRDLVNQDDPQVIEIWNNVFIQFNRLSDGSLEPLPAKHVDTGMGFERLVRAIQGKSSNYDTDVFMPIIERVQQIVRMPYGENPKTDIAMRVLADHIRAITFTICDGQLPSNTGAGYVIRRILRRAVRYAYSHLNYPQPILHQLVPVLVEQFSEMYPELGHQQKFIEKVIFEEENSFLRTLDSGLRRLSQVETYLAQNNITQIEGQTAFELYDTFGFPLDLTRLIASEKNLQIDESGFKVAMEQQKNRARQAAQMDMGDWVIVNPDYQESTFVGYDMLQVATEVLKYRKVEQKGKVQYQLVLAETPFYAESGGQVGDTGYLQFGDEKIGVIDTKKENNLSVHFITALPQNIAQTCTAVVNTTRRQMTTSNHSATHLLHSALRDVLGTHVQQKGSLVHPDHLRFDFSHFSKVTDEELAKIEQIVNARIRQNIALEEYRKMPIQEAMDMGATALFGEKYGDKVRVVIFDRDFSMELCGGTHVKATGEIGFCKINAEAAVSAGVRRIEAITGEKAYQQLSEEAHQLKALKQMAKNPRELVQSFEQILDENTQLRKELERLQMERAGVLKNELKTQFTVQNGINFLAKRIAVDNADVVKKIAYDLRNEVPNMVLVLGCEMAGKANLTVMVSDELTNQFNATQIIKQIAKHIRGGGGGQAFYATAGGQDANGIDAALNEAATLVK
jgi:alanyl-tRNA synthetase